MRIIPIFLCILGFVAKCCNALAIHEGGTVRAECYVSPSTRRTSPVYWYSYEFSEYLTEDYRVTLKTDLTDNLVNRLSVVGDNGNYNLKIINITYEDAGKYSCGYYSNGNRWVTVATKIIQIHAPIPPNPDYPLCATEPSDQLYPGMDMRLVCISRGGSPPASLTWYREGITLQTTSSEFESHHERTLSEEDNGVRFVCKSTSPGFDTTKECSVTPLRLIPHVRIYTSHDPVKVGEDVRFNCVGEGVPSISSYLWYWNGELITDNYSERLITSGDRGQTLTLASAQHNDNNALILCVIETETGLRNTDHIRLRLLGSNLPNTTPRKQNVSSMLPNFGADNRNTGLSTGAVFGCIIAGIVISVVIYGLVNAASRLYKSRRNGEFNQISMSNLNNYIHNQNDEEIARLNQFHNKTCNLGVIDLVDGEVVGGGAAGGDDYDHVQDNVDNRKHSIHSDPKLNEESYANPDFKNNSLIGCDLYHTVGSAAKDWYPRNLDPINPCAADKLSECEIPQEISTATNSRIRSHTVVNPTGLCHYQRPTRRMLPKIREDSNQSLSRRNLTHSLPDLTPTAYMVSIPIDIDNDYVNMDVATSPPSPTCSSETPDYHEYVNYKRDRRNPVARTDSSSSGYCEEPESPRLQNESPTKKLSYAELDFPELPEHDAASEDSTSTENMLLTCPISSGSPPGTCELTSYAQIAYVFKDRRQQNQPSVQRISATR